MGTGEPRQMATRAFAVTVPAGAIAVTTPPVVICESEPSEFTEIRTETPFSTTPVIEEMPTAIVAMVAPAAGSTRILPLPRVMAFSRRNSSSSSMAVRSSTMFKPFQARYWTVRDLNSRFFCSRWRCAAEEGRTLAALVGVGLAAVLGVHKRQHSAQPVGDHGALPPHPPQPGGDGLIKGTAQESIGEQVSHHGRADEAPQQALPLPPQASGLNTQSPAASGASLRRSGSNAESGSGWAAAAFGPSMMASPTGASRSAS